MLQRDPEKLKAWRKRSKGLTRGEGPTRRSPLRQRNQERRKKAFAENFGTRREWIVSLGCLIAGHPLHRCEGKLEAAHVVARGMGGKKGNRRHLVCLCTAAHREAGEHPSLGRWEGTRRAAFEAKYTVDLIATARELAERADALGYP